MTARLECATSANRCGDEPGAARTRTGGEEGITTHGRLQQRKRYNPTFPHCGQLRLFFEGSQLRMSGGSQTYSYQQCPAGRSTAASITARRGNEFRGRPDPQGIYWIRPDELDDNWLNCRLSDSFANAWGRYRISIHPFTTTETFGRGGFSSTAAPRPAALAASI